jgi:hypothetical protein
MHTIIVNDFVKSYRGKLRTIEKEVILNDYDGNQITVEFKFNDNAKQFVRLINEFKKTKINSFSFIRNGASKIDELTIFGKNPQHNDFKYTFYIHDIEIKFNNNPNNTRKRVLNEGVSMSAKKKTVKAKSKQTGLKLQMTVKHLKDFLNDIDDNTPLRVDYPMMDGMCEDQVSHLSYDAKAKALIINPLDTCIIYDMDKVYPDDVKADKEMVYAFSKDHKKITNEYHGRA